MIFMWRGIMTGIKHKVFKTTLLTFRSGRATSSYMPCGSLLKVEPSLHRMYFLQQNSY